MLKRLLGGKPLTEVCLDGIEFSLKHTLRRNMKRMVLRVEQNNHIKISSPKVSNKQLKAFIDDHKTWILQQHGMIKDPFEEGGKFYYLGNEYRIKHHSHELCLEGKYAYVNPERAKIQSDFFYKKHAKEMLSLRFDIWKEKMGLEVSRLTFRLAKRRWGSCNSKKNISLNPYMLKLDWHMIDYIIVHELAHLVHLNHSKAFYKLVQEYIPNYKDVEKEIKLLSLNFT